VLNKLNYLLGKKDFKSELNKLYFSNPDIAKALPALLAIRDSKIEIYESSSKKSLSYDFDNLGALSFEDLYSFVINTGLIKLFKEDGIKNLVDYALGVEVGLDSNGRKNRGGTLMEKIVEEHLSIFCNRNNFEYLSQVNAKAIKQRWGYFVAVDKSSRSFDFAVFNPKNNKIKLFEVNFYNGGGSKLKAVCGEFKSLYLELKRQNIDFVWITDGLGWNTSLRPLEEVYNNNEYVFNLTTLENGILDELSW
jgi:hypothetical protein